MTPKSCFTVFSYSLWLGNKKTLYWTDFTLLDWFLLYWTDFSLYWTDFLLYWTDFHFIGLIFTLLDRFFKNAGNAIFWSQITNCMVSSGLIRPHFKLLGLGIWPVLCFILTSGVALGQYNASDRSDFPLPSNLKFGPIKPYLTTMQYTV